MSNMEKNKTDLGWSWECDKPCVKYYVKIHTIKDVNCTQIDILSD